MTREDEKFLKAGLTHYPAAFYAVEEFTARIQKRLEEGLQRHWPSGTAGGGYRSRVTGELYIEAFRSVTLRDGSEASVSAGIGWEGNKSYFFVYCSDGPEWAKRPTAEQFERDGSLRYLCKYFDPTDPDPDIDHYLDAAIGEWENATNPPKPTPAPTKRKLSTRVHA
jgi:hypothetical protein